MPDNESRAKALADFAHELETLDPADGGAFARVITQAFTLGVIGSEDELSARFGISLPSVRRWLNGRTRPHHVMRKHVYAILAELAQSMGSA